MFQPLSEQKEATIYQYRLVRKLYFSPALVRYHWAVGLLLAASLLVLSPISSLAGLTAGLLFIPLLHFTLIRLIGLRSHHEFKSRKWSWRFVFPLAGYLPELPVELAAFTRLQIHLLWTGLCCIMLFYPWLQPETLSSLLLVHFWLLAPHLTAVLFLLKERRDGVVKLPLEESYYLYYHR